MRIFASGLLVLSASLSSCQSYPKTPSRVVSARGEYSSISDCVYLAIEKQGAWRKEDLPSMKTSRLLRGDDKYAVGKVEFTQVNPETTKVSMWFSATIKGGNYYPDIIESAVKTCSLS